MASITLNLAAGAITTRVLTAVCNEEGYSAVLANGSANPQTQTEFFKAWLMTVIKNKVKGYEANIASNSAIVTSNTNVDANIQIT